MTRVSSRFTALEQEQGTEGPVVVWRQADDGRDAFWSVQHPGVELTREEISKLTEPINGFNVVVVRVEL